MATAAVKTLFVGDTSYSIQDLRVDSIVTRLAELEKKYKINFVELKCKNCGGKIQQKYEDNIVKCPYCKSVYVIGIRQVNDKGV